MRKICSTIRYETCKQVISALQGHRVESAAFQMLRLHIQSKRSPINLNSTPIQMWIFFSTEIPGCIKGKEQGSVPMQPVPG